MRPTSTLSLALGLSLALAGCGDDGHDHDLPIDAAVADGATVDGAPSDGVQPIDAPAADAPASTVVEVTCAGATIASEVTAPGFNFTISDATIAVDAIVRFTMPASHNAVSGSVSGSGGTADGKFTVGFNQTKCLRFTVAGSFPFFCQPHLFTGTLTVGP